MKTKYEPTALITAAYCGIPSFANGEPGTSQALPRSVTVEVNGARCN